MIDLRLWAGPDAPGKARHALDDLSGSVAPSVLEDVQLLVSELVTNSVRHAGLGREDWIHLTVDVSGHAVRVEVTDDGPGFEPRPYIPSPYQEGGWGLYLVSQVADRWGVARQGPTSVWFEIDALHARSGRVSSEAAG